MSSRHAVEHRSFAGLEIRERPDGAAHIATLTGYAVPFNRDSLLMRSQKNPKPFVERFAPGAFAASISPENRRLFSYWNHDTSVPLARYPTTLRLAEDAVGQRFELDVPDTTAGRDLLYNVRAGIVDGVSVGFLKPRETWERGAEFDVRTITAADLCEISPTTLPAYEDTSIAESVHARFVRDCGAQPELRSASYGPDSDEPAAVVHAVDPTEAARLVATQIATLRLRVR